jgi:hypothetical protein
MPGLTKLQVASTIEASRLLIENAIADTEIQNALTTVGFTLTELQAGQGLLTAAIQAVAHQDEVAGRKASATAAQALALAALREAYQACVDRARLAAGTDKILLTTLGITGATPKALAALVLRVEKLLHTAQHDATVAAALSARGVDTARLADLQSTLTALKATESAQERSKGDSLAATQAQNTALTGLQTFTSSLKRGARIACKNRPDLLLKLGL